MLSTLFTNLKIYSQNLNENYFCVTLVSYFFSSSLDQSQDAPVRLLRAHCPCLLDKHVGKEDLLLKKYYNPPLWYKIPARQHSRQFWAQIV